MTPTPSLPVTPYRHRLFMRPPSRPASQTQRALRSWLAAIVCAALTVDAAAAAPAVPGKLPFQGFLTDASNPPQPLAAANPANLGVVFRIYATPAGGTPLWSEQQVVTVSKGRYTVLLGNGKAVGSEPFTSSLSSLFSGDSASDRYLGITVQGQSSEMIPRLRLLPAAYALVAQGAAAIGNSNGETVLAASADGASTTGTVVAGVLDGNGAGITAIPAIGLSGALGPAAIGDASVTAAKIAPGAVVGSQIVNDSISSEKIAANSLPAANVAANAVDTSKLANAGVDADRLAPGTVAASLVAAGRDGLLGVVLSPTAPNANLESQGYVRIGSAEIAGDFWAVRGQPTDPDAPSGRRDYLANPPMRSVWTGSKWLIWGCMVSGGAGDNWGNGSMFDPALNTWTKMATVGAPSARREFIAVWTGSQAIFQGGFSSATHRNGARFDPINNTWASMADEPRVPRTRHTAIWTGSKMIIFGGLHENGSFWTHGDAYDPVTDKWTPISDNGAPAGRCDHAAVWTGTEMLIFGGRNSAFLASGARYNPANDTWTPMLQANYATAHPAYGWSGKELVTWSGGGQTDSWGTNIQVQKYNPVSNTWTYGNSGSFRGRWMMAFVWTGRELVIFGGANDVTNYNDDGARLDPETMTWKALPRFPLGDHDLFCTWTGKEMLVTQGALRGQRSVFAYTPPSLAHLYAKP